MQVFDDEHQRLLSREREEQAENCLERLLLLSLRFVLGFFRARLTLGILIVLTQRMITPLRAE